MWPFKKTISMPTENKRGHAIGTKISFDFFLSNVMGGEHCRGIGIVVSEPRSNGEMDLVEIEVVKLFEGPKFWPCPAVILMPSDSLSVSEQ